MEYHWVLSYTQHTHTTQLQTKILIIDTGASPKVLRLTLVRPFEDRFHVSYESIHLVALGLLVVIICHFHGWFKYWRRLQKQFIFLQNRVKLVHRRTCNRQLLFFKNCWHNENTKSGFLQYFRLLEIPHGNDFFQQFLQCHQTFFNQGFFTRYWLKYKEIFAWKSHQSRHLIKTLSKQRSSVIIFAGRFCENCGPNMRALIVIRLCL